MKDDDLIAFELISEKEAAMKGDSVLRNPLVSKVIVILTVLQRLNYSKREITSVDVRLVRGLIVSLLPILHLPFLIEINLLADRHSYEPLDSGVCL